MFVLYLYHPKLACVAVGTIHAGLLLYTVLKRPYVHTFLNRLTVYGTAEVAVANGCAFAA